MARNRGIDAAHGTYIAFVDSDDIVIPYIYEKAYNSAEKYKVNVCEFAQQTFVNGKDKINLNKYKYQESKVKVYTATKDENPYDALKINCGSVWGKLWKRGFLLDNKIEFKPGVTNGEDMLFNWITGALLEKYVIDSNVGYCYRINRKNSAVKVGSANPARELNSFVSVCEELSKKHDMFKFKGSNDWTLNKILNQCRYGIEKKLKNSEDKKYFAGKVVNIADEYIKKYCMTLSKSQKKQIDWLRCTAKR